MHMKDFRDEVDMVDTNDLWEKIGALQDDEISHVLSRLFSVYEELLNSEFESCEARNFFQRLETVVNFCGACNLNRR